MNTTAKLSSMGATAAIATLMLSGCYSTPSTGGASATKEATVKCSGINSCKGKGACGTATHSCAGKNSCKGKGWVKVSPEECSKKGGKVVS